MFPFNYISSYYYGNYDCYVPTYGYLYTLNVPRPTTTPTPTITPTPTLTPSVTPTETPIPSVTPSVTPTLTPTPTDTGSYLLQENLFNILQEDGFKIKIY